jgi:hypothetical protein
MTRTVCGVCGWDRCRCETHPGYVIGSHWLETAYSRVCAGESEAEVLADYGYRRCAVNQRTTQFCGLLEAAVKAEREACAKACETVECGYGMMIEERHTAQQCAAAIRKRGET